MNWSFRRKDKDKPQWPVNEKGDPIAPAFLMHVGGKPMEMDMTLGLLEAYGIPHVAQYPNNGLFGKLILGSPPSGMEIFVPETMLEDAQNLLSADIITDDEELALEESED
ncbi:MAG: hypothetical protein FWC66_01615 [Oscillospiraceae bacterium]|nr:hypothetical protein [Oscillospiraceae bacterium]